MATEYAPVVIVGGGVAGLAAAKTLGHGVKYVLFEAQHYLGGRVLTVDAGEAEEIRMMRIHCFFPPFTLPSTQSSC